jgi:hypothetical protein
VYGYFPEPTKSILIMRAHNHHTISRSTSKTYNSKCKLGVAALVATLDPKPTGIVGPGEGLLLDQQCSD